VDNPFGVGRIQAVRNLNRPVEDFLCPKGLAENAPLQRLPFQELHRNEGLTAYGEKSQPCRN
jgi:hypothetical protein